MERGFYAVSSSPPIKVFLPYRGGHTLIKDVILTEGVKGNVKSQSTREIVREETPFGHASSKGEVRGADGLDWAKNDGGLIKICFRFESALYVPINRMCLYRNIHKKLVHKKDNTAIWIARCKIKNFRNGTPNQEG